MQGIELNRISQTRPSANTQNAVGMEEGRAPAHSAAPNSMQGDTAATVPDTAPPGRNRRCGWPTSRQIFRQVRDVALIGVGAGLYRGGEAIAALRANSAANPSYTHIGTLSVAPSLVKPFNEAAAVMRRSPGAAKTLDRVLNARPDVLGHALTLDLPSAGPAPAAGTSFIATTNSMYWDPDVKMIVSGEDADSPLGVVSPVNNLLHEMKHWEHADDDFLTFLGRAGFPHPEFDTLEEKAAIDETNRDLRGVIKDSLRFDHHNTLLDKAKSVTDNSLGGTARLAAAIMDITRSLYSKSSAIFPTSLSIVNTQAGQMFAQLTPLRKVFPRTLNSENVLKMQSMVDYGRDLSARYATAKYSATVTPELQSEMDTYVAKGDTFMKELSAGTNVTLPHFNAPAPAPTVEAADALLRNGTVPRPPLTTP